MNFLLSPELTPFVISAGLVICFLALEILLMLTGLGGAQGSDGGDLVEAAGFDQDIAGMNAPELAAELEIPMDVAAQIEGQIAPDFEADAGPAPDASSVSGIQDILGIRKVPLTIWLALFFASFSGVGLAMQAGLDSIFGWMLPRIPAAAVALVPALAFTRGLAGTIARLIPRDETTAISENNLGRKHGVVTVGTARRGSPAQVRITDHFGNVHYTMLEPLSEGDVIEQGAEVLVLRLRRGELRMVQIG